MSATLQNSIRLRGFLILLLSIVMNLTRVHSSKAVHKASGILDLNYFLYAIVLLLSLFPFRSTWFVSICAQTLILGTTLFAIFLGGVSTSRCVANSGCVQTLPMSLVTLLLLTLIVLLDLIQWWTLYKILKQPEYVSNITQRIRILFSWVLPFAWLVNVKLIYLSSWSIFKFTTFHIVADPLIIMMSKERGFTIVLMAGAIVSDFFAYLTSSDSLVTNAIMVQIAFTSGGLVLAMLARKSEMIEEQNAGRLPEATVIEEKPARGLHKRKSKRKHIHF